MVMMGTIAPSEAPLEVADVPSDVSAPNQASPSEPALLAPTPSTTESSSRGAGTNGDKKNTGAITGAVAAGAVAVVAMALLAVLLIRGYRRRDAGAEAGVPGGKNIDGNPRSGNRRSPDELRASHGTGLGTDIGSPKRKSALCLLTP